MTTPVLPPSMRSRSPLFRNKHVPSTSRSSYLRTCTSVAIVGSVILAILVIVANRLGSDSWILPLVATKTTTKTEDAGMNMGESIIITYKKLKEGVTARTSLNYVVFAAEDKATQQPITVKQWAELMATSPKSEEFAKDITALISNLPYKGVFFETKGVTSANADQTQFEICLVDGHRLADSAERRASPASFQEHLQNCPDDRYACQFANLYGTATLIAPRKVETTNKDDDNNDNKTYSHLAAFLRGAPERQVVDVWKMVSSTYHQILETRAPESPVWLSTAGQGVPWLHFRFDRDPKYYKYAPFANEQ